MTSSRNNLCDPLVNSVYTSGNGGRG